jgi:hypothetical protein
VAFRDDKSDHRHIEYFQSLEKFHKEGLPNRLPWHLEHELLRDTELFELDHVAQTLVRPKGQPESQLGQLAH